MNTKAYFILLSFTFLSACEKPYKPETEEEKTFVKQCMKSEISGKECGCKYQTLKKKYSLDEMLSFYTEGSDKTLRPADAMLLVMNCSK